MIPADAPERIYLQHDPEETGEPFSEAHDVTWCKDSVNASDIEYVRADFAKRAAKHLRDHADAVKRVSTIGMEWVLQTDEDRAAKEEHDDMVAIAAALDPRHNDILEKP